MRKRRKTFQNSVTNAERNVIYLVETLELLDRVDRFLAASARLAHLLLLPFLLRCVSSLFLPFSCSSAYVCILASSLYETLRERKEHVHTNDTSARSFVSRRLQKINNKARFRQQLLRWRIIHASGKLRSRNCKGATEPHQTALPSRSHLATKTPWVTVMVVYYVSQRSDKIFIFAIFFIIFTLFSLKNYLLIINKSYTNFFLLE